ncbi:S8 family serine peptidase [Pelagicoccus sp. NFK12]|uniref:S8 family serine peptidase n=1 Tax=Pelagicoccus enzymogenes TaxID=2773457 RepID=A0A927IJD2_9BACT|nr:S8 family serine peptidase [Pelagicoccus enzymogenes]MBD5782206.1 S8 family serine peptidase [Pelagicoccus enzymogenes]
MGEAAALLEERVSPRGDEGLELLEQLYAVPGLAYPVRVEQTVSRDPATGEVQVLDRVEMAADRLIGRFEDGLEASELQRQLAGLGMVLGRRLIGGNVFEILLPSGGLDDVPEGLRVARQSAMAEDLVYLEPDYMVHAMVDPSDPSFADGSLWGLRNEGQEEGVADVDIDAPEGWALRSDASEVVVAVIDTGINYLHRDLVSNLWVNALEIPGNGIDDDANGWIDDVYGINAVAGTGDPFDDNGHGTHCSGTLGAQGDNGEGIVGVAWDVQLMGLKFLSSNGGGKTSDAIVCIEYALAMGADLLSNSWGGAGYSQALRDAIAVAEENGVAFVAAAGNAASDNDQAAVYPASYDLDNVVSVASVDRRGDLSAFSNYGLDSVDLAAPGTDILSSWIGGEDAYRKISGTSMATPHVSGVLALLLVEYPESGLDEQLRRLFYGGKRLATLEDRVGFGVMANLAGSLQLATAPQPPVFVERLPRFAYQTEGSDWEASVLVESEFPVSYEWFREGVKLAGQQESRLGLTNLQAADAGVYSVVARNQDGEARGRVQLQVLEVDEGLAEAVDAPFLEVYSYGDAKWNRYAFDSVLGADCIRSGEIGDDGQSSVFTEVMGPARVSFSWRLSAERYWDYGSFWVDGAENASLRENGEWVQHSVSLTEPRRYRLEWQYCKDRSTSSGQDALFLDEIEIGSLEEGAPLILQEPVGGVVGTGASYQLSVEALGGELEYQWFKDGVALEGAVSGSLAFFSVSSEDAGIYTVIVSNPFGDVTSRGARIEIADIPVRILSQPENASVSAGERVVFEVELEGSLPYSVEWYKDDVALAGADSPRLTIAVVGVADAGEYFARVSNASTPVAVETNVATLEVRELSLAPRFVKQPQSGYWKNGDTLFLSAAVEGSFPFTYQWFKDSVAVPGEVDRVLSREAVVESDGGVYRLQAQNAFGTALSAEAEVLALGDLGEAIDLPELEWNVEGAGYFFAQEEVARDGMDALESGGGRSFFGTPVSLWAEIEGPTNFYAFWREESSAIPSTVRLFVDGEVMSSLSAGADWHEARAWVPEGRHLVSIEGLLELGSTVWIDQGRLSAAPAFCSQSESLALEQGQDSLLAAEARGAGTLAYQWYRDGVAIPGAVESSYPVSSSDPSSVGRYFVVASNAHGSAQSADMLVRVFDSLAAEWGDDSVSLNFGDSSAWQGTVLDNGEVALRSLGDGEMAVLTAEVTGPGTLVFDLGIRSLVGFPSLGLIVDGRRVGYYSDSIDKQKELSLKRRAIYLSEGVHQVEWRFARGSASGALGAAVAYLDNVKLLEEPVFAKDPRDTRVVEGGAASLSVSMVGAGPFAYQWFKDGVALAGQKSAQLQISGANEATAGLYHCVAKNEEGFSAASAAAEVTVILGYYDALGLDFGRVVLGGEKWEPVLIETPVGQGALALAVAERDSLNALAFDIEVAQGGLRALEFWIRASDMGANSLLQVYENNQRHIDILESDDWQRVVIPLSKSGTNRLSISLRQGSEWELRDPEVALAGFRLMEEPVVSRPARAGGIYWGDSHMFSAEVVGNLPFTYRWSKAGQTLRTGKTGSNQIRYVVPRLNDEVEGVYDLVVENDVAVSETLSREVRLLSADFGGAVGWSGTRLRSYGDTLWELDEGESLVGSRSLSVGSLSPLESSELVFDLKGPGVFLMNWKLDSPSGVDELSITGGGKLLRGLYSSSDWVPYELFVPEASFQFRIQMLNRDGAGTQGGRAWVDGLRFLKFGGEGFYDWSTRVFAESGLDEAERGLRGDPEGDGLPNLAEYAFGFDPLSAEVFPTPRIENGLVIVEFPLQSEAVDTGFALEVSRDLATWYPLRSQYDLTQGDGQSSVQLLQLLTEEELRDGLFVRLAIYYLQADE